MGTMPIWFSVSCEEACIEESGLGFSASGPCRSSLEEDGEAELGFEWGWRERRKKDVLLLLELLLDLAYLKGRGGDSMRPSSRGVKS